MVSRSNKKPDWLPPGWQFTVKSNNVIGRKWKVFVELETQQKFYSEASVLRYIKDKKIPTKKSKNKKGQIGKSLVKKEVHPVEENDPCGWLPAGWIVESRLRKGHVGKKVRRKIFIEPSTGNKFFSKPEVYRYLESIQGGSGSYVKESSVKKEMESSRRSTRNRSEAPPSVEKSDLRQIVSQVSETPVQVVFETTVDEELPAGWIKEVKKKKIDGKVVRQDPFYLDPASDLVFRSKPNALQYIKTGVISRHAFRRKNGIEESETAKNTPLSSALQKATPGDSRVELSIDGGNHECGVLALAVTSDNTEAEGKESEISASRNDPGSVHEPILDRSTLLPSGDALEMLPARPLNQQVDASEEAKALTKVTQPEVKVDGKKRGATNVERNPSSTPSKDRLKDETEVITMQGGSNGKAQTNKRKKRDAKIPSLPSRSSKRHASVTESSCLSQPANYVEEMLPAKSETQSVTQTEGSADLAAVTFPFVKDAAEKVTDFSTWGAEPSSATSRNVWTKNGEVVAMQGCSDERAVDIKRKRNNKRMPSLPPRSSKRFASTPESCSGQPPANSAQQILPVKTVTQISQTDELESVVKPTSPKVQDVNKNDNDITPNNDGVCSAPARNSATGENPAVVAVQDLNNNKDLTVKVQRKNRREHNKTSHPQSTQSGTSVEAAIQAKPIKHIRQSPNRKSTKGRASVLGSTLNESLEKHQNFDVQITSVTQQDGVRQASFDAQTVLGTQQYSANEYVSSTQRYPLIATQEYSANEYVSSTQRYPLALEIDLEQYPPGFSPKRERSPFKIEQALTNLTDKPGGRNYEPTADYPPTEQQPNWTVAERERSEKHSSIITEKSAGDRHIQVEQPPIAGKTTEQPDSQFCFTSPLWSDPCLDFAFKTLTGAIPLDDNVAIQDYIQHQLRTSTVQTNNIRSLPDVGVPSFFQNEEAKPAFPWPEDPSFLNSNGFGSHRPGR